MTRILIDCTRTVRSGLHTGIQRVVRQTLRHGMEMAARAEGPAVIPVVFEQGRFIAVPRIDPHPFEHATPLVSAPSGALAPGEDDVLLLADAGWYVDGLSAGVRRASDAGAQIVPWIHDLISIQFPHWFDAAVSPRFATYLDAVLPLAAMAVSVSHTTDQALAAYLREHAQPRLRALAGTLSRRVHPPGADTGHAITVAPVSPRVQTVFDTAEPCLIQVGSIEPRKNHALVLDACERAWQSGARFRLVLIGAHGWKMAHFAERLACHPRLGERLFHLKQVSDADLAYAYRRAAASIHASAIEGFGLPIAEAGHHRVPVLLSDTPIHREVGGPRATYFSLQDHATLAQLLAGIGHPDTGLAPDWAKGRHRGWAHSTRDLLGTLAGLVNPCHVS